MITQQSLKAMPIRPPLQELPMKPKGDRLHVVTQKKPAKTLLSEARSCLIKAFGDDEYELRSRLSKSHLSPKTISTRILFLQQNLPDSWEEFIRSRTTAFSCSRLDFEKMLRCFMETVNERNFDAELAQKLGEIYAPGIVRRLLEIKSRSMLTSEVVLERIEEVSKVTYGVPLPPDKAWLLATNARTYRKWRNRMTGFQNGILQIKKCGCEEIAERWIHDIIRSDARSDQNTFRLIDRIEEIFAIHGPDGLRDLLLLSKKSILNGSGSLRKQDGFSRIPLMRFVCRLKKRQPLLISNQPDIPENAAYIALSNDNDIAIRVTRGANGEQQIRKIDAPLLGLHLRLFFAKDRKKAAELAAITLRKILSKKSWNTRDETKLWIIRNFAIEQNESKLQLLMSGTRLRSLFQSGPPLHREYNPDLSANHMVKLCSE
ncbi:hypothetical protein JXA56_01440 [Candidatus Micrarchaeota archaeon]|nr:hypothetical protein [Candidatus Micrarchaeota archaeon]